MSVAFFECISIANEDTQNMFLFIEIDHAQEISCGRQAELLRSRKQYQAVINRCFHSTKRGFVMCNPLLV